MKRPLLTTLVLSSCISIACAQNSKQLIDSAYKLIEQKNFGKAINIYSNIITSEPKNAEVYELRGLAYQQIKDYESAFTDYDRSLVVDPKYWVGYLRRADLFGQLGYMEEAIKDYDMAFQYVVEKEGKETILVNRAQAKQRLKNLPAAETDYRKALEINASSIAALTNLGSILPDLGKVKEGIQCLEKVIKLDSTFEGGYGNLAFLYSEIGEYKKALEVSNKLLSFKPNEAYALNNRGYIKLKLNDTSGALEDINNSILENPQNSYAFRNRGLVYLALKKNREACMDFKKAVNLGYTQRFGNDVEELLKKHCVSASDPAHGL